MGLCRAARLIILAAVETAVSRLTRATGSLSTLALQSEHGIQPARPAIGGIQTRRAQLLQTVRPAARGDQPSALHDVIGTCEPQRRIYTMAVGSIRLAFVLASRPRRCDLDANRARHPARRVHDRASVQTGPK